MTANKRPTKRYRPRRITRHTLAVAMEGAAKPAAADRRQILAKLIESLNAFRMGKAGEYDWSVLAGSLTLSQCIEKIGVVRGLSEHLATTERVLNAIQSRALQSGRWAPVTLYGPEIEQLRLFVEDLHAFQLEQLGRAEFLAAIDSATATIKRAGDRVRVEKQPMEAHP